MQDRLQSTSSKIAFIIHPEIEAVQCVARGGFSLHSLAPSLSQFLNLEFIYFRPTSLEGRNQNPAFFFPLPIRGQF